MPDIIEAGTNGLLTEAIFSEALRINDELLRTLEAERTGAKIPVGGDAKGGEVNLLDMDEVATAKPSKVQASLVKIYPHI